MEVRATRRAGKERGWIAQLGILFAIIAFAGLPAVAQAATLSWSGPNLVTRLVPGIGLSAVACPSASQCTAVDGDGSFTSVGAQTTFNPTVPAVPKHNVPIFYAVLQFAGLHAVACPSTTQCTAVTFDDHEVTFDPTMTTPAPTPVILDPAYSGSAQIVTAIACPSVTQCTTVDKVGAEETFDPTNPGTPHAVTIASTRFFEGSLACPSVSQCTAVDYRGNEVTFNPTSPAGAITTAIGGGGVVACPSTTECVTVDGSGNELTFDPTSPGTPTPTAIDSGNSLTWVACPAANECVALDNAYQEVTFDPTSPATVTTNGFANVLTSVACASSSQCTALNGSDNAVTFNPQSGATTTTTVDFVASQLASLTCPSASVCAALDSGQEVAFDPTVPGTATTTILDPGASLNALACPSASECTAVDGVGQEVTFNPSAPGTPTPPVMIDPGTGLNQVACPSTSQCTAVDGNGSEVTFNPTSPGTPTPMPIGGPNALACPSTSQCTVVYGNYFGGYGQGEEWTFNPTAPGTPNLVDIDANGWLNAVACPSTTECVAFDYFYHEVTFNPTAPYGIVPTEVYANAYLPYSYPTLQALACPSTSECVAADAEGNVIEGDPGNSTSWKVTHLPGASSLSVSCISVGQCVAVDDREYSSIIPVPVSSSPPSISGSPVQDRRLTEAHGSWINSPSGYTYQWQRCDSGGAGCAAIAGASAQSYTLTASDVGSTIRVQETASNLGGAGTPASSMQTAVVSAPNSGGGGGPPPPAAVPPKVTGYRITNNPFAVSATSTPITAIAAAHKHRQGTTFEYSLSEAATVKIVISARLAGRRRGKSCVAPTKKLSHAKECVRIVARGTLTRTSHQGANKVAFSGRIGSKALKPGHYRATLIATDTTQHTSTPQTIYFTIVKQ